MNKKFIIIFLLLVAFGLLNAQVAWKCDGKKVVTLKASPGYGSGTDWESLFYDLNKSFTVGPQGEVFVSNINQHNIVKFSPEGKQIAKFGQKGQGPGDLHYPGRLSVLDDKYLVVGVSNTPKITIYSPEGKELRSIILNMNPLPVTSTYIKQFKERLSASVAERRDWIIPSAVYTFQTTAFSDSFNSKTAKTFPYGWSN